MPRQVDPARRCVPLAEWPARDRTLWAAAIRGARGRFTERGDASRLKPPTIRKAQEGYGRWLGFLGHQGCLDPTAEPLSRVTAERAANYFDVLRGLGNADYTIVGRFAELHLALRLMQPGADLAWLIRPGGVPLRQQLELRKRDFLTPGSAELYAWGLEMAERSITLNGPRRRQVMLRDGLLIALLAIAGPRLRAVHALEVGKHLSFDGQEWWLHLGRADMKQEKVHSVPLPASLTPWIKRYLSLERLELLAGKANSSVWVNWGGLTLGEAGIDKRIRWWSAKKYGAEHAFGVHRFRHAIGTTAPLLTPNTPQLGAAVLAVTGQVHEKHYHRGKRAAAAGQYLDGLDADKRTARELLGRSSTR